MKKLRNKLLEFLGIISILTLFKVDQLNQGAYFSKVNFLEKRYLSSFSKEDKFIPLPKLPKYRTGEGQDCSAYVRLAAYDLFSKEYSWAHAWERRKKDKVVDTLSIAKKYDSLNGLDFLKIHKSLDSLDFWKSYSEIDSLEKTGILKPGMLVGGYHRAPSLSQGEKERGRPAKYTHVLLYVGRDGLDNPTFFDEWNNKQRSIGFKEMYKNKLLPMEIIDDNPQTYVKK